MNPDFTVEIFYYNSININKHKKTFKTFHDLQVIKEQQRLYHLKLLYHSNACDLSC